MSMAFGEHLRELRKSNTKYTQEDMAKKLNISRSTYTYYETGKSEPSFHSLHKICETLMVDYNTLFDYNE
ncbi:MAG: helix-turn-helix transcriptional regulator [Ruminococcus sp.]|nr:helix-turn-helix transcriptional regulator [Ruminococcus sp.]